MGGGDFFLVPAEHFFRAVIPAGVLGRLSHADRSECVFGMERNEQGAMGGSDDGSFLPGPHFKKQRSFASCGALVLGGMEEPEMAVAPKMGTLGGRWVLSPDNPHLVAGDHPL